MIIKSVIQVISAVIVVISLAIILFVVFLFKKNKSLVKNSINIFILNLILIDLLKCCFYIPMLTYGLELIVVNYLNKSTTNANMEEIVCNLNSVLVIFFETIELISFTAISYERQRMIISPLTLPNKRINFSKAVLIVTWTIALVLTLIVFVGISYQSNFDNLNPNTNNCHLYIFHITNVSDSKAMRLNYVQNKVYDYYHLAITFVSFGITLYFYLKIFYYLKMHEQKFESNYLRITKEMSKITARLNIITPMKRASLTIDQRNSIVELSKKPSFISVYSAPGVFTLKLKNNLKINNVSVEGDVCILNKSTREKGKRKLEVRMSKKSLIIMTSFVSLRIFFISSIILRQYSFKDGVADVAKFKIFLLEILFIWLSFFSCFLNSFTFIMVTDFFKQQAKQNFTRLYCYLKNIFCH